MQNEYLDFAKKISYKAKEIILKYYNAEDKISYKDDNTVVSIADRKINEYLIEQVKKKFPTHSVDGEEESFGKSDFVWVCDPIDGTAMYVRGIPVATFSLALVYKKEPIIGVVYDPFNDDLYTATKNKGAYKNNEKISVNNYSLIDKESIGHFDMFPKSEYDLYDCIRELNKKSYFVSIGSIVRAGVSVAEGKFTCAIFPGTIHKNCDIAALKVIVEEAGGVVKGINGLEQDYSKDINGAIISNKKVYPELLEIISENIKL